jgi:transposase
MILQDIVLRLKSGYAIKAISRELNKHKSVVKKVRKIAIREGWLAPDRPLPEEWEISEAYNDTKRQPGAPHPLDTYKELIQGWLKQKDSFIVIHQHLSDCVAVSESTVRRYIHRECRDAIPAVYRRPTIPGQVMEVDFGSLGLVFDSQKKRNRKAWFFSGRLRHSRRAYREVVFDQKQETFFACHIHAFEHFGGVPERVTPDNLKAAVIKASFQSPLVNRAYRELALHYGFLITPCAPYTPQHKGGVENDVKYVKRNFLPRFREKMRRLGKTVADCDELQRALEEWDRTVADVRIIQKVGRSPQEIFTIEEQKALNKLPATRWDPVTFMESGVRSDHRVQFEKAFYSVPHKLIGEEVLVMGNSTLVRIFHDLHEVACHPRAKNLWEYVRRPEHSPPFVEEYLTQTTQGLITLARQMGEHIHAVASFIAEDKAVDAIRPVRSLVNLAKTYSVQRCEAACHRALAFGIPGYINVKNILVQGLDMLPLPSEEIEASGNAPQAFRFAREYGYFAVDDPAFISSTTQEVSHE